MGHIVLNRCIVFDIASHLTIFYTSFPFLDGSSVRPASLHLEINLTLEIGQLLLSLLHAWGLDKDLDKVATTKLGLLRPRVPVSYGILSRGGAIMSLMLPTWNPGELCSAFATSKLNVFQRFKNKIFDFLAFVNCLNTKALKSFKWY